jgi:hypothetical protein
MPYYGANAAIEASGAVYTYSFQATALSSAGPADIFTVTAPTNSRVAIRELRFAQTSDFGDAQAEILSLIFMVGSTSTAPAGTAITGTNVRTYTGTPTAGSSVTGPTTTLASTSSATLLLADAYNVAAPYLYIPPPDMRFVLGRGQRFVARIATTPNDALTVNGTLTLQEIGQSPQ